MSIQAPERSSRWLFPATFALVFYGVGASLSDVGLDGRIQLPIQFELSRDGLSLPSIVKNEPHGNAQ
jgi:hypothetical protein